MRYGRLARLGLIAAIAVASVSIASAQQARMYGTVSDETGAGVPTAKVILQPIEGGARVEVITKGKKGSYLIGIIRPGTYAFKVEAPGLVVTSINAKAIGSDNKKEPVWTKSGRVQPDKPEEMKVEDGMEITCDVVLGKGTEIATASGEKTLATADQALGVLTQRVQKGDCAGALAELQAYTTANPTNARGYYLSGYCDAVLEKDADALVALERARELEPTFAGTSTLIGKIHVRNKRLPEAEAAFQKELENPAAPTEVQMDALLSLGGVQRDQGKDGDAIATFEKAMAVAPSRPEAYLELSALYAKAGQADKAAATLDKAKEMGADNPAALLNVGISYFNKKDYAHAETMFRRVTESNAPNSDRGMAYALLGKLQLRDGKNADAIASFQKSLELDPTGRLAAETQETLKALQPKKK